MLGVIRGCLWGACDLVSDAVCCASGGGGVWYCGWVAANLLGGWFQHPWEGYKAKSPGGVGQREKISLLPLAAKQNNTPFSLILVKKVPEKGKI